MRSRIVKSTLVLVQIMVLGMVLVSASAQGPYVASIWQSIIISDDTYVNALITHELDAGVVPRPEDIGPITDPVPIGAGFTLVSKKQLGQTFLFENNRVWPTGIPYIYTGIYTGQPDPAFISHEWRAEYFRKALHRLINRDEIEALYTPMMQKAEYWLPPGQAMWIKPGLSLPDYNPMLAVELLDDAGFVQGTRPNPDYRPYIPWSAQYIRIDPISGLHLDEMTYTYETPFGSITWTGIEYYAIGPVESPLGFEMATMIADWWRQAGIPVNLVAGSWLGMVIRLVNNILEDYQIMTDVGIVWGRTSPDILCDLTYSKNIPLWNFVYMNYSEPYDGVSCIPPPADPFEFAINRDSDYWVEQMFRTFNVADAQRAAYEIQEVLATHEPYLPLLEWNTFYAFTGPWGNSQGYLGIVNARGFGPMSIYDEFGKMLGRADRQNDELMVWGLSEYLDGLNPLTSQTHASWTVLHVIVDRLLKRNPYSQKYMAWAADPSVMNFDPAVGYTPIVQPWVGPGREQAGGNGVYDAPVTYAYDPVTGLEELDTYNNIPVELVREEDLQGDDTLGMRTYWRLRENLYWHDTDPGPDGKPGTADDGPWFPVTTGDVEFTWDVLIKQQNIKYFSIWWWVYDVTTIWDDPPLEGTARPTNDLDFQVYEERRWVFAFEGHSEVSVLLPMHIWEQDLAGPDGEFCTDDDRDHRTWMGWEVPYIECPIHPGYMLSRLIGFGPYHYHIDGPGGPGWQPGVLTHVEANTIYFGTFVPFHYPPEEYSNGEPGRILRGDVNLNQLVDMQDLSVVIDAFGSNPGSSNWDPKADIAYPAQAIGLEEIFVVIEESGQTWGPYRPFTIPAEPEDP